VVRGKDSRLKPKRRIAIITGLVLLSLLSVVVIINTLKPHAFTAIISKLVAATKSSPPTPKPPNVGVYSTPQASLDLKGTGSRQTGQFKVSADWDLVWSYDCSAAKRPGPGNFIVSVFDSKGRVSTDTPPIMQFQTKGSGVQHYHKAGAYFLGVRSSCTWHIQTQRGSNSSPSASPASTPSPSPTP
jgi:hypothetical protein